LTLDEIETKLRRLGYGNIIRENSKNLSVLTDEHRVRTLEDITQHFSAQGAIYDPNKGPSSIGAVVLNDMTVRCRPANRQGKYSPGVQNEIVMYDEIKGITKNGAIKVRITDGTNVVLYKDVVDVLQVSKQFTDRKKADLILVLRNGDRIPLSIKQDNAEMWESADSYWAGKAKKLVDELEDTAEVEVTQEGRIFNIQPNIAVKATRAEKQDVIFGNDILNKGLVLVRTFKSKDFALTSNNDVLEIQVSKVIDKLNDVDDVYFIIRNDRSRKGSKIRPGIRVLAVDKTRVNGGTITVRR